MSQSRWGRLVSALFSLPLLLSSAASCKPCPEGQERVTVAYVTGPAISARGAVSPDEVTVEYGENALNEDVTCFAGDHFVRVNARTDNLNQGRIVHLYRTEPPWGTKDEPWNLEGSKVRVLVTCENTNGPVPQLFRVSWFEAPKSASGESPPATLANVGEMPASLGGGWYDSGLVDGRGVLCIHNPTNVRFQASVEVYVPETTCVPKGTVVNPSPPLRGGSFASLACGGAAAPPEVSLCSDPEEVPGYHEFCQVCEGSVYTERTTKIYSGYCHDEAWALAHAEAENCLLVDDACPDDT